MEQGSKEWHEFRRQGIGASDAPKIMGVYPKAWGNVQDLWLEKIGAIEPAPSNEAMKRGLSLEAPARAWAERELGLTFTPAVRKSRIIEYMYASLDGITDDNIAIEIKCPLAGLHEVVPEHYYPQLQHQLYVTETSWMYYMSYNGEEGKIIKVDRDEEYIARLLDAEKKFWDCVLNFVEPESNTEYLYRDDTPYQNQLILYLHNKSQRKHWAELEDKAHHDLIAMTQTNTKALNCFIRQKTTKGSVNYKKLIAEHEINVEPYRNKPTVYWEIREGKDATE